MEAIVQSKGIRASRPFSCGKGGLPFWSNDIQTPTLTSTRAHNILYINRHDTSAKPHKNKNGCVILIT